VNKVSGELAKLYTISVLQKKHLIVSWRIWITNSNKSTTHGYYAILASLAGIKWN